jgi:DNA-binding NtrC family response regulator
MSLNIVYLDDEEDITDLFLTFISANDRKVEVFNDHHQVLEYLKNHTPDIFFTDYRLSGINGDQVSSMLDPKLPKVLITGDSDLATKSQFVKIFPKPIAWDEIDQFLGEFEKKKILGLF